MKMQNIPVAPVKRLRTALEARRPPNSTRLAIEVGGVSYLDLNPAMACCKLCYCIDYHGPIASTRPRPE